MESFATFYFPFLSQQLCVQVAALTEMKYQVGIRIVNQIFGIFLLNVQQLYITFLESSFRKCSGLYILRLMYYFLSQYFWTYLLIVFDSYLSPRQCSQHHPHYFHLHFPQKIQSVAQVSELSCQGMTLAHFDGLFDDGLSRHRFMNRNSSLTSTLTFGCRHYNRLWTFVESPHIPFSSVHRFLQKMLNTAETMELCMIQARMKKLEKLCPTLHLIEGKQHIW